MIEFILLFLCFSFLYEKEKNRNMYGYLELLVKWVGG